MTENIRYTFAYCTTPASSITAADTTTATTIPLITFKNLTYIFNHQHNQGYDVDHQEDQDILFSASSAYLCHHSPSPTLFHHRRSTIVQFDPSALFVFELSVPTHLLAKEMNSGILLIAPECHRLAHLDCSSSSTSGRSISSSSWAWRAYCNGRKVGYAVRGKPSERDKAVPETLKSMSAGTGVLFSAADGGSDDGDDRHHQEGELLYMRACYEGVVGSRKPVSYHLINPAGGGGDESPTQGLTFFLLRTGLALYAMLPQSLTSMPAVLSSAVSVGDHGGNENTDQEKELLYLRACYAGCPAPTENSSVDCWVPMTFNEMVRGVAGGGGGGGRRWGGWAWSYCRNGGGRGRGRGRRGRRRKRRTGRGGRGSGGGRRGRGEEGEEVGDGDGDEGDEEEEEEGEGDGDEEEEEKKRRRKNASRRCTCASTKSCRLCTLVCPLCHGRPSFPLSSFTFNSRHRREYC